MASIRTRWLALLYSFFLFLTYVHAFDNLDHEIFDLTSDIEDAEGKGTTFYSWLDVPASASSSEISRAYRQKSLAMHPDKNPGVKNIQKRFARLGVVAQILRNAESRERYDFYQKNGVPRWRGTGYYYARYRPGLGTVMIMIITTTSAMQYWIQSYTQQQDLKRIRAFILKARRQAWGQKMVPVKGQRKVKVNMRVGYLDNEDEFAPGKMLDMVVDGDDVFIIDPDGGLTQLSESDARPPSLSRTWFALLVKNAVWRIRGQNVVATSTEDVSTTDSGSDYSESRGASSHATETSNGDEGTQKGAHGGKRRKGFRK